MSISYWKSTLIARPDLLSVVEPLFKVAGTLNKVLTVFDLETSTFIGRPNFGITEIGMLHINAKGQVAQSGSLVNPEHRIHNNVISITGITNEMVCGAPNWGHIWLDAVEWMARDHILIGFNSKTFDIPALKSQHNRYAQKSLLVNEDWDVRILHQYLHRTQKGKLADVARLLKIDVSSFKGHRALNDVVLTAAVLSKMVQLHPTIIEDVYLQKKQKASLDSKKAFVLNKEALRHQIEKYYLNKKNYEQRDLDNIAKSIEGATEKQLHTAISFEISNAIDEGRIQILEPIGDKKVSLSNIQLIRSCAYIWQEKKRLAPVYDLIKTVIPDVNYMDVRWILNESNARPLPLDSQNPNFRL